MKTQSLKSFSRDLLFSTAMAIAGAIVIGIIVLSSNLQYFGDKSEVLIPLLIGMPIGAALIPAIRLIKLSLSKGVLAFLFSAVCTGASIIGIVAAMDLFGSWCAFVAPLAAGACSCVASRLVISYR